MASFKTYIFKILCSTALLSIFACSSDDDGGNDFSPKTTILIAGYEDINDDDYARLWENGIPQNLSNIQPNTRAKDVFVTSGGDVYMAINDYSNSPSRAIILKNGEQIFISEPESSATINSIFITNNDVYACGYIVRDNGGYPAYWKNGILTELGSNSGSARDIFVDNDDVYVCGGVFNQSLNNTDATYWKNGIVTTLNEDANNRTSAIKIIVKDNDVHILGEGYFLRDVGFYWKNGINVQVGNLDENSDFLFNDFAIDGANVYIVGNVESEIEDSLDNAVIWKNGNETILNTTNRSGRALGLEIINNDIYVMGTTGEITTNSEGDPTSRTDAIKVWRNTTELYSYPIGTSVRVTAMAVKN